MDTCANCGKELETDSYDYNEYYEPICYVCCAIQDSEYMRDKGKSMLYLCKYSDGWYVTNWPGSLKIKVNNPKKGKHNIAGSRYDVGFRYGGKFWHGVQYGEWTQVCHCKVVRGK